MWLQDVFNFWKTLGSCFIADLAPARLTWWESSGKLARRMIFFFDLFVGRGSWTKVLSRTRIPTMLKAWEPLTDAVRWGDMKRQAPVWSLARAGVSFLLFALVIDCCSNYSRQTNSSLVQARKTSNFLWWYSTVSVDFYRKGVVTTTHFYWRGPAASFRDIFLFEGL